MKQMKHSKQRDMIRAFLDGNENHPTADEVYLSMRRQDPTISLGTVYRNLNQLAENGDIRRIAVGDGKDRYDFRTAAHGHFICRQCGKIRDIFVDEEALKKAGIGIEGTVEQEEVIFYGICNSCLSKGDSSENQGN